MGGAREVDSAVCWIVWAASSKELGPNIRGLFGREGQASGFAGRVSGGSICSRALPPSVASWEDLSASLLASRLRWAICRAEAILLPDHIQAYFSDFLRFCLSRSL